jgi:hypothetical protein
MVSCALRLTQLIWQAFCRTAASAETSMNRSEGLFEKLRVLRTGTASAARRAERRQLAPFADDALLARAVDDAIVARARIAAESPDLLALDEMEQVNSCRKASSTIYQDDAVNPYVALAGRGRG